MDQHRPKAEVFWRAMRGDPAVERLLAKGEPDLDAVLDLYSPTTGEPAFDPAVIGAVVDDLETDPPVDTGHPFLDLSVKVGLAHIDATFQGDHPKYGGKSYADSEHDSFPPAIIAAVDALSAWGHHTRAQELFTYWLSHFVRDDGTIDYYGPSLSEYGQLLHTAALVVERAGAGVWLDSNRLHLDRMVTYLLGLCRAAQGDDGLLAGVPEADTRKQVAKWFHNNAWVAKGLRRWAETCARVGGTPRSTIEVVQAAGDWLAAHTIGAIERIWPEDPEDWWLSPRAEPTPRPRYLTDNSLACYTNYRYWPELLSSDLLSPALANRIVDARLSAGGQFCGMTRFGGHLDDWPLADYLSALWRLGRRNDFFLSLYGHIAYHQARDHLTAYEQVSLPPGQELAPYCLPCQLVAARAARMLVQGGPRPPEAD